MAKRETMIPKAPVARIIMNAGGKRVSQGAIDMFTQVLEEIGEEIGKKAIALAKHTGRKTVQEEDIKLAARQ